MKNPVATARSGTVTSNDVRVLVSGGGGTGKPAVYRYPVQASVGGQRTGGVPRSTPTVIGGVEATPVRIRRPAKPIRKLAPPGQSCVIDACAAVTGFRLDFHGDLTIPEGLAQLEQAGVISGFAEASARKPGVILGVNLPAPHALVVTEEGWWSWGALYEPSPLVTVEEAWEVQWRDGGSWDRLSALRAATSATSPTSTGRAL